MVKGTFLEERFLVAKENETSRETHVQQALIVGLDNPIIGVGGGNYMYVQHELDVSGFSHNSYTEAFANFGLPGLLILLSVYLEFIVKLINALRSNFIPDKRIVYYLFSFLIAFMIYNIFYVTYLTIEFMGAFIIARAHLDHMLA